MTDFQKLLRHFRSSEIVIREVPDRVQRGREVVALVANSEIRVSDRDAALFNNFRPTFYVSAGERTARLDKVEWSKISRRTVAYYSIVCRNPKTRKQERYAWRYVIRNGVVELDHTFPVSVR